jgi:hypothetical protein
MSLLLRTSYFVPKRVYGEYIASLIRPLFARDVGQASHAIAAFEFVVSRFINGLLADVEASQLIRDRGK